MHIKYERHLKVDGNLIFLNSEIEVNGRIGILSQIGQAGIYVKFPLVKNDTFINFKKIESLKEGVNEKSKYQIEREKYQRGEDDEDEPFRWDGLN